jgi:hypothetical protein
MPVHRENRLPIQNEGPDQERIMREQNSPPENAKEISLRSVVLSSHLQRVIGEKYCSANRIVVLGDTPSEIKVAVPEHSLTCIDEIRKVLPRQKRIDLYIGDQLEIEWVFVRGYDLYDLNHSQ